MPEHSTLGVAAAPVHIPSAEQTIPQPEQGTAVCLSGGGYRAMLFHAGALWRLLEAGILGQVKRISSVSGGSITSAVLGLNWSKLHFDDQDTVASYREHVIEPVRKLASRTIDASAILGGALGPGDISDKIILAYKKYLFGDNTLQDLPDHPRFVINATNVQSGVLWRFSKPYMRDYRVGKVKQPTLPLAVAVAASSAFPPVLSPVHLELEPSDFEPKSGLDLQKEPFTTDVYLTDGGVYDNLGLETAWKRYSTVLVSDGGGKMQPEEEPKRDWARHSRRVLDVIDNQVRSLRKRQLIDSYKNNLRTGAYWGIRTNIQDYGLSDPLPCPHERTLKLAETPTRLKRLPADHQERLINSGYAVCDAALRSHVKSSLPRGKLPYPGVEA